jgi:Uma2 family endonuclease
MIGTGKKKYTYADYEKLPEGAPYQLIGGELVKSPSPTVLHQDIISALFRKLVPFVDSGMGKVYFAPLDVYLSEVETYQPDLMFITNERLDIIKEKNIQGAPDLVIEVLSPCTAYYDLRHKKEVYAEHGVVEYWVVDPMERSIEIYENRGREFERVEYVKRKGSIQSHLFEGFIVSLAELFGI